MTGGAAHGPVAPTPDEAVPEPRSLLRPGVAASSKRSVEGAVQVVIMLAIGTAAGAGSFRHVHDVAAGHGQVGWLAWADAVVLELMSIASGLELRRRKRAHEPVKFPAIVMGVAVVLSLGAQVVEAERSIIGWIAAAIPAMGFLVMVKIALARAGMPRAEETVVIPPVDDARSEKEEDPGSSGSDAPEEDGQDPVVAVLIPAARAQRQRCTSRIAESRGRLSRRFCGLMGTEFLMRARQSCCES